MQYLINLINSISVENCINIDKNISTKYPEISIKCDIRDDDLVSKIPKNIDKVVLLAAEHRDDVSPTSLYYDVNVKGTQNVLDAMDNKGVANLVFTSSVAIYGLNKNNPDEKSDVDPFNHYGKSKWEAEEVLRSWLSIDSPRKKLTIIRPTVIFGENNRGNVYNLLKQISSGRFLIVGSGNNKKSMAYVKNVVEFIKYKINNNSSYEEFNYVDVPDFSMNQLVKQVEVSLEKKIPSLHLPYIFGILGGYFFDFLKMFTKKNILISSVRVKKFCATTQFNAKKAHSTDYKPPFSLEEGLDNTIKYEFQDNLK